MPGSADRPPDLVTELRTIRARLKQLEDGNARHATNAPWQTPTLLNSFSNYGVPYATVGYYVDQVGRVYLRGALQMPNVATPVTIFTLAAAYRPVFQHDFVVAGEFADGIATSIIAVETDGDVRLTKTDVGLTGKIVLDTISFRTS